MHRRAAFRTGFSVCLVLCAWLALGACDPSRVYEENQEIPDYLWYEDSLAVFEFEIPDASQPYNLYYNVRNSLNYPYYNLYVTYYLEDSTGKEIASRLQEMVLMDPRTGEPYGSGLGDIFDHQILALPGFTFPYAGPYTLKIKQYMRENPLPEVMSVGLRIEKGDASASPENQRTSE
ncbi:gliding motility-associated lipoprotein GldH [Catalinimonas alkaloidigena]|uniref:Gliding motility-associated lipoprotein GldH n=2 Tax=Catalinimonas alkaloidigena TaxID=1075417 RepID=A0A1G8WJC8_9BACT|nr:gliding motility-associated lipoprotein GldH [Catalinimonas alkaloidigena]